MEISGITVMMYIYGRLGIIGVFSWLCYCEEHTTLNMHLHVGISETSYNWITNFEKGLSQIFEYSSGDKKFQSV